MQIPLYIKETLSEYYEKVREETRNIFFILELFLDIYSSCPICGGKDCARFFNYYTRQVVDENGNFYEDFPIARFICYRKGNDIKVGHKTFSLLPYQLIPYHKYCIEFTIESSKSRNKEGKSITGVLDHLAARAEDDLSINGNQILRMDTLIEQTIDKVVASGYYPAFENILYQHSSGEDRIKSFLEYAEGFECLKGIYDMKGPCALGYDFYLSGGGYYKNAHFLFGTASQFRERGNSFYPLIE